jgi:3-oxoacyl-[acyl-carrier protein] reductase
VKQFDHIQIGDSAELSHSLTQQDLDRFIELSGDVNRLHTDKEFSSRTYLKKPVAHGMLGVAFISTVIGTKLPGSGALWYKFEVEFKRPARVGDELTVRATVLSKRERDKSLSLQVIVSNQDRQILTEGKAEVRCVEPEEPNRGPRQDDSKDTDVALVLGASGGIGAEVVRSLSAQGFDIVAHGFKNFQSLVSLQNEIRNQGRRVLPVRGDLKKASDIDRIVNEARHEFGRLNVVVHAASARLSHVPFEKLDWARFSEQIELNIRSSYEIVNCVLPLMKQAEHGKFIFLSSQYVDTPKKNLLPYITAKSALEGFARGLALELAPLNITSNLVSPGMTDTSLLADVPEKIQLLTAATTPLQRLAAPQDIAGAIAFLASGKSNFITGETIRINGGQVML